MGGLRASDVLERAEEDLEVATTDGVLRLAFDLPLRGISLLELRP